MSQLSSEQLARSRRMQRRILQGIADAGQCVIAEKLGVHATTVGRMLKPKENGDAGEIERLCDLLALTGLKVVPQDYRMLKPEVLESMLAINKEFYRRIESVDDLAHDEISDRNDLRY